MQHPISSPIYSMLPNDVLGKKGRKLLQFGGLLWQSSSSTNNSVLVRHGDLQRWKPAENLVCSLARNLVKRVSGSILKIEA